eukprot:2552227-Rhodomonas_salina.2
MDLPPPPSPPCSPSSPSSPSSSTSSSLSGASLSHHKFRLESLHQLRDSAAAVGGAAVGVRCKARKVMQDSRALRGMRVSESEAPKLHSESPGPWTR